MKVTLKDGKEFTALGVHGRSMQYQGVQRDSLIFIFDPATVTLEEIMEAFTEISCSSIALTDNDDTVFFHENPSFRKRVGVKITPTLNGSND